MSPMNSQPRTPVIPSSKAKASGLAIAIVLALVTGLVAQAPVMAAEQGIAWGQAGGDSFHDLPGVKPQDPANQFGEGYTCETHTVASRRLNTRDLRDSLPYTVYRCEKNGIVYEGTQPPQTGRMWYPGVNPRVID